MREIKFRGYSPKEGRWSYGDLLTMYADIEGKFISDRQDGIIYRVRADTVGQYTGLKDKNGKEIYEGDVVKIYSPLLVMTLKKWDLEAVDVVVFKRGVFCFRNHRCPIGGEDTPIYSNLLAYRAPKYVEIIGNIYENPELLEEVENETS